MSQNLERHLPWPTQRCEAPASSSLEWLCLQCSNPTPQHEVLPKSHRSRPAWSQAAPARNTLQNFEMASVIRPHIKRERYAPRHMCQVNSSAGVRLHAAQRTDACSAHALVRDLSQNSITDELP